jgi:hypothetical protein
MLIKGYQAEVQSITKPYTTNKGPESMVDEEDKHEGQRKDHRYHMCAQLFLKSRACSHAEHHIQMGTRQGGSGSLICSMQ